MLVACAGRLTLVMLLFVRRFWLKIMLNGPSGGPNPLIVIMIMFSSSVVFSIALLFLVVV